MRERLGKELADVAIGTGIVLTADELAQFSIEEITKATGGKEVFGLKELPPGLEHGTEVALGTIEKVTPWVATALIIYAGFKHMMKGVKDKSALNKPR